MFTIYATLHILDKLRGNSGILLRNFSFTMHKLFMLLPARINYLLWEAEVAEADENEDVSLDKSRTNLDSRDYEQFYERSYHGFWCYFCRTFYDYFAPKPYFIASVWRVTRDDYHDSRSRFYILVRNWKKYTTFQSELGWEPRGYRWTARYRRMVFRFFYLPQLLVSLVIHIIIRPLLYFSPEKLTDRCLQSFGQIKQFFVLRWSVLVSCIIIFLTLLFPFYIGLSPVSIVWIITNMAVIMPASLLWQTFIFFYKTYNVSKFTTQNQRFWKRSLTLFWLIEGFLFLIVIFIWFISPDNLMYGINHQEVLALTNFNPSVFISTTTNVTTILVIIRFMTHAKSTNNRMVFYILSYLLVLVIFSTLVSELSQLFNFFSKTSELEFATSSLYRGKTPSEVLFVYSNFRESVVKYQVQFLIIFIKFWHVLFIVIYIVFNILQSFESDSISYDSISSVYLNCTYLFMFNLTSIVLLSKHSFYFVAGSPAYHYFINDTSGFIYYMVNNILYVLKSALYQLIEYLIG